MKNIKTILIAVLSFMLLFSVSCKNEDKTGGGDGGGSIPTASGSPANVGDAEFEGTLNNISLVGGGWTEEQVNNMIYPFALSILDNKVYAGLTMRDNNYFAPIALIQM